MSATTNSTPNTIANQTISCAFNLFVELFNQQRSFIICEEDVVPSEGQFTELLACSEPWCSGLHLLDGGEGANEISSLGCMKFSAALTRTHFGMAVGGDDEPNGPETLAQMCEQTGINGRPMGANRSWRGLDLRLYSMLGTAGFTEPHLHGPAGRHLGLRR